MSFDPFHSQLEKDPARIKHYISLLEEAFGRDVTVNGILEIGSYAKCEAVPSSDNDTRVYVTSPRGILFNVFPGLPEKPALYDGFVVACGNLPRITLDWDTFNGPVADYCSEQLGCSIELGFADQRYAAYELEHLDEYPSAEHSLLLQSHILYDPHNFLSSWREKVYGKRFDTLANYYQQNHLDRLWFKVYESLESDWTVAHKLSKSGQIRWVQNAVRCLRNAVAAKTYIQTGVFTYLKADVLDFYRHHLPGDYPFVEQLYRWKTDPQVRAEMVQDFINDQQPYFARFREMMPALESVVQHVKAL